MSRLRTAFSESLTSFDVSSTRGASLLAASALTLAVSGCSFVDPNEPPPPDQCVLDNPAAAGENPQGLMYLAFVDNPPVTCEKIITRR